MERIKNVLFICYPCEDSFSAIKWMLKKLVLLRQLWKSTDMQSNVHLAKVPRTFWLFDRDKLLLSSNITSLPSTSYFRMIKSTTADRFSTLFTGILACLYHYYYNFYNTPYNLWVLQRIDKGNKDKNNHNDKILLIFLECITSKKLLRNFLNIHQPSLYLVFVCPDI